MTTDGAPSVTLPAASAVHLAELFTDLDQFLRSSPLIADELASFLVGRSHTHAQFSANNLIDDVSFTASHLRKLACNGTARAPGRSSTDGHCREHQLPGN